MAVEIPTRGLRIAAINNETVASLDPVQGLWTVEQYLALSDHSRHLIEFSDGYIEVLPMPTSAHQAISRFLLFALFAFVQPRGGTVLYAPLRLQVREGKFREPDLLLLLNKHDPRHQNAFWLGADLVIEIVSPDNPERDTITKRADYAEARIPEYWIVDPLAATVIVLTLRDDEYTEHGVYRHGESVISVLLTDFAVRVDDILDAQP